MQERRSEVRMMFADLVEACWKDPRGRKRRASALLEDISISGACLQTEIPVPVGVDVRWSVPAQQNGKEHTPKKEFVGRVRYCEFREIGYFVGVEFDPASKWSKNAYTPQHLLDLKRLMAQSKR